MVDDWDILLALLPEYAIEIGAAFICGLLLGLERERKDKPAGLRTIVLITVGSTIFMMSSTLIAHVSEGPVSITRVDPSRIAAGVVSGIGFLGAGTIIQGRGFIQGLTTAAVIWVSAGIGLCIGLGFPILGFGLTLVALAALMLLDPVNQWLERRGPSSAIAFVAPNDSLVLQRVETALEREGVRESDISFHPLNQSEVRVEAIHHASRNATSRLLIALSQIEGVRGIPRFGTQQ